LARYDVIFSEGKYPKGVFYIHNGIVKVYKHGNQGKEQIIQIFKSGDLLGFRAMLSEKNYNVHAQCLEKTEVCFISKKEFMTYLDRNPLIRNKLIQELSMELQDRADYLTDMAQKSVKQRTAMSLVVLHDIYNEKEINLSREDIANMVGTATETLIRLLMEFKKNSVIDVQGRKIKIVNLEKLKQLTLA
jgi:CRP/FNR family transcriptional regulator